MNWTDKEDDFIRANYQALSDATMATFLGRTECAVTSRLCTLRLQRNLRRPWSKTEDRYLRRHYLTTKNREMGAALARSLPSIIHRLHMLKLHRPAALREKMKAETRFKKGFTPHNKGIKGAHHSPATEFKKGNVPPNTKFDGCIAIRHHRPTRTRYKYIRIAKAKWQLLHHYVWEKKHGKIPRGHLIAFKNGDTLDCRLRNLKCISRAQNCRRNYNREKAGAGIKRAWQRGAHLNSDKWVAFTLAPGNPELQNKIIQDKSLLDMQRSKLKLRRSIHESDQKQSRRANRKNVRQNLPV